MRRLLAAPVLAAALAAAPAAPVPKDGRRPVYFPTRAGTAWVMTSGGTDAACKVTAAAPAGAEVAVTVEVGGRRPGYTEEYRVSDAGVWWVGCDGRAIEPRACVARFPHRPGDSWPVKTTGGAELDVTVTAHGPEEVTVPAGTFKAVRVTRAGTQNGQRGTNTHWYAPGVGIVRGEFEAAGQVWELKSFTPAND